MLSHPRGSSAECRGGTRAVSALAAAVLSAAVLLVLVLREPRGTSERGALDVGAAAAAFPEPADLAPPSDEGADRRATSGAAGLTPAAGIDVRPGVRLVGPGRLQGAVRERGTGAGVSGARVELFTQPPAGKDVLARIYGVAKFAPHWQNRLEPVATAASGAEGAFSFEGVRAGTYFLEARGAFSVPEQAVLGRVDREGAGGPVEVFVRPGGRVVGRVLRPDGSPARGARVVVYPGATAFLAAARQGDFRMFAAPCDLEGRFAIPGVPPGEGYDAAASGEGFALSHRIGFAIEAGRDTEIEILARAGASIHGVVLARGVDGGGAEHGEPVAGARVAVLPRGLRDLGFAAEVIAATAARTDAQGAYVLHDVPPGEVDVVAVAPGLLPAKSTPVAAAAGTSVEAEPIVLSAGPHVTLRFEDGAGAPIEGVETSWYVTDFETLAFEPTVTPLMLQAAPGFEFPRSDANGVALAGPFPGSPPYVVYCWRPEFGFREVRWDPASDGDELVVRMDRGGVVEGIVIDLERAEPVTRFEIRSGRRLDWQLEGPSTVNPFSGGLLVEDPDGRFRLEALAPGDEPLAFTAPGFLQEDVKVDVLPGETTRGMIVKLRPGGTIRGQVLDAGGEPLAGAQVAALDDRGRSVLGRMRNPRGRSRSPKEAFGQEIAMGSMDVFSGLGVIGPGFVVSGADGEYELTGLPAGTVVVGAAHRDHADGRSAPVQVAAGEPLEGVDVVLSAGGGVFGTVRDRFGAPVVNAIVLLFSAELLAQADPSLRSVQQGGTGPDGAYRIENVVPGGYVLACARGDEGVHLASFLGTLNLDFVTVPPNSMVRVDLTDSSAAAVRVHGTLVADREPVHGGGLFAMGFESESALGLDVKVAQVGTDGSFAFEGLAPGTYSLTYQGEGAPVRMEAEVPDAPEVRLDLSLPSGRLEGRVLEEGSREPIARAEVALARVESSDALPRIGLVGSLIQREGRAARAWSDRDGRFAFTRLQAGRYRMQVGPPRWGEGGAAWAAAEPIEVEVVEGSSPEQVEVLLRPSLELRGRAVDGTGRPVARARIYAFPHEAEDALYVFGRSGDDGAFTLRGLAPGGYDLSAAAGDGLEAPALPVDVGATEEDREVVLVLVQGVEVTVRVTDAVGAPVRGAAGRLVPLTKSGRSPLVGAGRALEGIFRGEGVSGTDGLLSLGRHAPGTYRLEVGRGALRAQRDPVRLAEGAPVVLDLELK